MDVVEWSSANLLTKPWFRDSSSFNNKLASSCRSHYDFHNDNSADINGNAGRQNINCLGFRSTRKFGGIVNFPMLGMLQNQPEVSSHRIPMDFSPYLLSASPPKSSGFEIMGYSSQCSNDKIGLSPSYFYTGDTNSDHCSQLKGTCDNSANLNKRRNGPLKSIIMKSDTCGDSEGDYLSPESPLSPIRVTKKVSFADHKGLALAQVRFVKEGPDEPPFLNPEILSSLTEGASADVTCKPPIKLCFPQPASDYLSFRDKVSTNLVMLENVMLKDYTVEGTIKVKNISFEKHVFVRLSLDEWETYEDTDATYVPGLGLGFADHFDTFSFRIDIPPKFDVSKAVQFAVCFEENGHKHWDSNGCNNYCIISENCDVSKLSTSGSPCNPRWLPDKCTDAWSEFSVWRASDSSTPYY
uniref:CBM21 domain-containing protein n=2 Tax=Arion vulgaris TaxID=1028688 RepID=A0A0B7ATG6_9EUPU